MTIPAPSPEVLWLIEASKSRLKIDHSIADPIILDEPIEWRENRRNFAVDPEKYDLWLDQPLMWDPFFGIQAWPSIIPAKASKGGVLEMVSGRFQTKSMIIKAFIERFW